MDSRWVSANNFPVLAETMNEKLEEETTVTVSEVTGEKQWRMIMEIAGSEFYCYGAGEDEKEIFHELLSEAILISPLDSDIWQIIEEEMQVYFAGTHSLEQAVDGIENRLQLMLAERWE